jgi:hypothetical protein
MKKEYDFSHAARGKFYRKNLTLRIPIYLDAKLQNQLETIAKKKGQDVQELVNKLLKKEIDLISELS